MRYAAARDLNEPGIVEALEEFGCKTIKLNEFDRLVLRAGKIYMLEIKNPDGRDKLTDSQEKLLADGWPLHVVRTTEEALKAIGL